MKAVRTSGAALTRPAGRVYSRLGSLYLDIAGAGSNSEPARARGAIAHSVDGAHVRRAANGGAVARRDATGIA